MTAGEFLKLYGVGVVVFLVLDLIWLGVVAKGFYERQIGHLMRSDVQWAPALLFYLVFVAALVVFVAAPAVEKQSPGHALGLGAFFGLASYAAFDLTCLALFKGFPLAVAVVDLAWGAALSAAVCGAIVMAARTWS